MRRSRSQGWSRIVVAFGLIVVASAINGVSAQTKPPVPTEKKVPPKIQLLGHQCSMSSIMNTRGNGTIISDEEGNNYLIDEADEVDTSDWMIGDNLLVCYSAYKYENRTVFAYSLRDLDDDPDEEIDATLIQ